MPLLSDMRNVWWPACWQMPAFVWYMEQAHLATGPFKNVARITNRARAKAEAFKFQRETYFQLLPAIHPRDMLDTCESRADRVLGLGTRLGRAALAAAFSAIAFKGQQAVVVLAKTLLNGWTTSTRMHEMCALPCIFGCKGIDEVRHYLACQVAREIFNVTQGQPAAMAWGLAALDPPSLHKVIIFFRAYHVLKMEYR